ncbi:hypothetical protein BD770DRAFT_447724 [Pilaira anomala]|nr:hypothetical protein BD770DRAFT_447724 [Pilaira anomala]
MLENKAFKDVFCWDPSGTTFLVKDTNEFSKSILPKHFKHCNFASFVRQLNKYDFHKIRSNADESQKLYGDQIWEFEHCNFKRDRKDLLEEIKRKTPGKKKKTSQVDMMDTDTPSPTIVASTINSPIMNESESSALAELRKLTKNLQSQVYQLKQSQIELEATVNKMDKNDKLIMAELSGFQQSLKRKDEIIKECLKLTVKTQQEERHVKMKEMPVISTPPPSTPSTATATTTASTSSSTNTTNNWGDQSTIPIESILTDLFLPSPPQSSIDTASVAAAAAQLNGGSLIGSSIKTSDGLTFLALGRLTPNNGGTPNDNDNSSNDHNAIKIEEINNNSIAKVVPADHVSTSETDSKGKKKMVASWTTPPRVLLVDDDSVYRDVSGRMLNMIGCSIDLAKDGLEALQKMSIEKYDLILMDIVMPKMDGIATTRNIRRYDAFTPIVSMTSNFTHNDIMEYIGIGMNDILPKPFSKNTLYDILEKHCAHLKIIQRQQTDEVIIHRGLGIPQANITPLLEESATTTTTTTTSTTSSNYNNTYPTSNTTSNIVDTPSTSSSTSSPINTSPTIISTSTSIAPTTSTTTNNDSGYWQPVDSRKLVWSSSSVQQKYHQQPQPHQQNQQPQEQQQQQRQYKRQKLNDLYDAPQY